MAAGYTLIAARNKLKKINKEEVVEVKEYFRLNKIR
jgi:hypothetical protein